MMTPISSLKRLTRVVLTMIVGAVLTAFVLMSAVPDASQFSVVCGAVVVALVVALYDMGLFRWDAEV